MKKKKTTMPECPAGPFPAHAEIAALAHAYWQAEGCPEGAEWRHWLRAEAALLESAKSNPEGSE